MLKKRQNLPSTTSVIVPTDSGHSHRQPIGAAILRIEPRQLQGVVRVAKGVASAHNLAPRLRRRVSGFGLEKGKGFQHAKQRCTSPHEMRARIEHYETKALESKPVRESPRSTRVPLKVVIKTLGITKPLTCDGETIVVNLHGALISTTEALTEGMRIEIQVYLTGKRAKAQVVYIDPNQPLRCGIALSKPENIWGVSLPSDDWSEDGERS